MIAGAAAAVALLVVGSFLFAGPGGVIGAGLGLATGTFGAYGLFLTVKALRGAPKSSAGVFFTVLMFVMKFPVIGLGGYVAFLQGIGALAAFVAGVLVVYSALVWRAARSDLYPR